MGSLRSLLYGLATLAALWARYARCFMGLAMLAVALWARYARCFMGLATLAALWARYARCFMGLATLRSLDLTSHEDSMDICETRPESY